jgi:hypothetical protein
MVKQAMNANELLRPHLMECGYCYGEMLSYVVPFPLGFGFCSNCHPEWVKKHLDILLDIEREKYGLPPLIEGIREGPRIPEGDLSTVKIGIGVIRFYHKS